MVCVIAVFRLFQRAKVAPAGRAGFVERWCVSRLAAGQGQSGACGDRPAPSGISGKIFAEFFCHQPDTPGALAETASGIHGGRHSPDSCGKSESSFRDASFRLPFCPSIIDRQFRPCCSARQPCSRDRQRGACRQSAVPMNITQIICQVLPGRNLAAKAASVLERHVFTESGGNS